MMQKTDILDFCGLPLNGVTWGVFSDGDTVRYGKNSMVFL